MITSNVIHRTFQIKWRNRIGSCFTIDVDGKQYLCSAKHYLNDYRTGQIELFYREKWHNLEVEFVGHGSENTDICVLSPKIQLSPPHSLSATSAGLIFGQDVYFLGFPYGIQLEVGDLNRFFPLPLVKKATVSSFFGGNQKIILLDGHNNRGFSGGPVVFKKVGSTKNELRVAAIISGYKFEPEPIFDEKGKKTSLRYYANTGIILSYDIKHALDAIRENPIGFEIKR